ncbi:MAG: DUF433 domain-containing protein [Oscillatoriales cyanobacterium]|nr:MAG: DUF433 domain-containing protein [Oscillatoriales cyanobacterium]
MTSALIYPHIEKVAGQPARLQRIPRVRVAQIVMDYLAYGWSVEEMCRQHPYLMQSEAHAAMAYYFDFQAEIDREIRMEWEQVQQEKSLLSPSPLFTHICGMGVPPVFSGRAGRPSHNN